MHPCMHAYMHTCIQAMPQPGTGTAEPVGKDRRGYRWCLTLAIVQDVNATRLGNTNAACSFCTVHPVNAALSENRSSFFNNAFVVWRNSGPRTSGAERLTPPTMARCPESLAGPAAHWARALPSWQPQRQPWKRPDEGCKASMHLWVPCTCCKPRPLCSTKPVRRPVSKAFASPLAWSCFSTSHLSPALAMTSRGRRWCPTFGTHNGTRMANCCAWWSHWVGISAHALRWQLVSACRGVFCRCSVLQRAQNPGGFYYLDLAGTTCKHSCTHAYMHTCIHA